jgi:hypothetical protein
MNGQHLDVTVASPERYRIRIGQTQMVLPYSYGFNMKKGKKSAPVLKNITLPKPAVPGDCGARGGRNAGGGE